jgi:predicted Zn-dependent protease
MSQTFAMQARAQFQQLHDQLLNALQEGESFTLSLTGEESQFVRLNRGRLRQTGQVEDASVTLCWMQEERQTTRAVPLSQLLDSSALTSFLLELREELALLPNDPFVVLPTESSKSEADFEGSLLPVEDLASSLLAPVEGLDLIGSYVGGRAFRASANSLGGFHWFCSETFSYDYSLMTVDDKMVKGQMAGAHWDQDAYIAQLAQDREWLALLNTPSRSLEPGTYRTYLTPGAFSEIVSHLGWGALSENSLQQGTSALLKLRKGESSFSPLFTLSEDFSLGLVPRFNSEGSLAPEQQVLIDDGALKQALVSNRTAREFGLESNAALLSESPRSMAIAGGKLPSSEVLSALGTGLYLSNLHYLNWSDQQGGRITGMTRYACFWVEDGKIVAPIENMRFDETIYRCFGSELEALTTEVETFPTLSTYFQRNLGGLACPGALLKGFTFTL